MKDEIDKVMNFELMFFPALITTLGLDGLKFDTPLSKEEEMYHLDNYYNKKNMASREIIILKNMRLVSNISKKYTNEKNDKDDLISIGTIGLIKGVDTYKPDTEVKLSTYVTKCIENEILMHFRKNKKNDKVKSIEEETKIDKEGNVMKSCDIIKDESPDIIKAIIDSNDIKKIKEEFNKVLTREERYVIIKRYGLFKCKIETQKVIAKKLNISRSYVSRIEKIALLKLRKMLENDAKNILKY